MYSASFYLIHYAVKKVQKYNKYCIPHAYGPSVCLLQTFDIILSVLLKLLNAEAIKCCSSVGMSFSGDFELVMKPYIPYCNRDLIKAS